MNLFWRCFMNWFIVFCAFFAFIFTSSWHLSESYSWVHENIMNFIHGFMAQFIGLTYSYSWTLLDMPWIIHRFHEYIHRFHEYIFTVNVFFLPEKLKNERESGFLGCFSRAKTIFLPPFLQIFAGSLKFSLAVFYVKKIVIFTPTHNFCRVLCGIVALINNLRLLAKFDLHSFAR